jgi:serine/threonine protein kinase
MPEVMKTVGRYELLREVGRGGMALVYLARQTDLDRFVALKELGAFHASDPSFAQRFLRESRVAGSLSHPNIVTVHDYFEHDGTPYIAMEYIERGSLRPYIGRMNLAQIGGVLEGLLAGLTHGESHGIVHRDLKPENLMVTSDGRVKIADFGIAKATTKMQTGAFLTATGTTVGTPTYMAPEQAMAQDIGAWTDLYSVGCMAFEMFTGNVPFHDSDAPMAILLRHVNEPIAPVISIRPEVDPRISAWVEALLVKEPTQRTQNAMDAWDDFEEILLSLLGPRWRREARLVEREQEGAAGNKPLTPAPFPGTTAGDVASEEFKSFAWGAPASDTGPAASPPMYTPPPSATTPSIPDVVVGPPTPMPSQAVPAPPAPAPPAPDPEPVAETGFVTFASPAPPPPTDALIARPAPAPAEPAPAADRAPAAGAAAAAAAGAAEAAAAPPETAPAAVTQPPIEAAAPPAAADPVSPSGFAEPPADLTPAADVAPPKAFETYIAPPPSRPPTSEPKLTPPPVEAVAASAPAPAAPLVAETMMPQQVRPPAPPAPPAAPTAAKEPSSNRRFVIPAAIVGGVAVAAVIGIVLTGGGGDGSDNAAAPAAAKSNAAKPAAAAVPVSASGIALKVPAGWSDGADAVAIPGLADGAVTVGGPKDATIVFGKADDSAANSTLVPDDLRTADLPAGTPVDLADGVQALKYDNLKLGDKTGSLFVVPTTEGVATLACIADGKTCASIASSLQITEGKAFPVGPSEAYSDDVQRVLGRLEKQEKSAASALNKAGKRTSQVTATGKLGTAYTSAAGSLRRLEHSPADLLLNVQLVGALETAGGAYKKATSEGKSKDRAGYKREGSKALAARADMSAALAGLKTAGYTLPAGLTRDAAAFTRLPTLIKDKPKKTATPSSGPSTQTQAPQSETQSSSGNNTTPPANNTPPAASNPTPKPKTPTPKPKDPVTGGGEG